MTAKGVHNAADMFKWYNKKHPNTDIDYKLFKHILDKFFKSVSEMILEGKTYNMGHRLGKFSIKKVKRTFKKPVIDFYETNKLKKQGIIKTIYYTDEYWYRWYWEKKRCQVKNKTVYSFRPTKGPGGNTKKLVRKLKQEEFSNLLYAE